MADEQNILYVDLYNNKLTPQAGDYNGKVGLSRNLVGISIQVCNTEQKKLPAGNAPEVSPE